MMIVNIGTARTILKLSQNIFSSGQHLQDQSQTHCLLSDTGQQSINLYKSNQIVA